MYLYLYCVRFLSTDKRVVSVYVCTLVSRYASEKTEGRALLSSTTVNGHLLTYLLSNISAESGEEVAADAMRWAALRRR